MIIDDNEIYICSKYKGMEETDSSSYLEHYGMPRRSGRYPYGSGKDPYQHSDDFLGRIEELKKAGLSEKEIAESMDLTTSQLRTQKSLAKNERRALQVETAKSMRAHGFSLQEIANKMGFNNDSSVRALLNADAEKNMMAAQKTAEFLKKQVEEKGMIDVGSGVEKELRISKEKLNQALYILELEGYPTYGGGVAQATNPGKQTNLKVLCPPGTEHKEIYNYDKINSIGNYTSKDGGETFEKFRYPAAMDAKRLEICYAEKGGLEKDGLIEIRRGCKDLDLGDSTYAQVRIMVDGKSLGATDGKNRYLKGMCVYSDDLPKGVDVRFNTNKKLGTAPADVLKTVKDDPENPFGSLIKAGGQYTYKDKNGNEQLGLINKRAEEGDWNQWSNKLPAQFLSKQSMELINRQLNLAKEDKVREFDEIMSLNNPVIKKNLLKSFSDDCDSAAVHLQAAALPRQKYHVILPVPTLKDNEIYAPNYKDGEKLALVRFPHGGTFEIPVLTVNNKHADSIKMIGKTPKDAVCINSKVAERLSGADFDGDTALCIPTNKNIKITSTNPLKGLEGFDSKSYKYAKSVIDDKGVEHLYRADGTEFKRMKNTQTEMGIISNLITDMTLKGASESELARAVRHSMVVIDAEKHKLDYKQSYIDNDIKSLKNRYQLHYDEKSGTYKTGASTLISQAKGEVRVEKRKGSPIIDPKTGEQTWKSANETYVDSKGNVVKRMQTSTKMAETKNAFELSSGTEQEKAYARYANSMKALANEARKAMINTENLKYNPAAKAKYADQVKSLNDKLNLSLMNAPKERKAQIMANAEVKSKKLEYPDLTKAELKKIGQKALMNARIKLGAERTTIDIDDKEWEAIQAGAISNSKLTQIVNHANMDILRSYATPRNQLELSDFKKNKLNAMLERGYTTSEVAEALGISTSSVIKYRD